MLALLHTTPTSFSENTGLPKRRWEIMERLVERLGYAEVIYVTPKEITDTPGTFSAYYRWLGKEPFVEKVDDQVQADMVIDRVFYAAKFPNTDFPILSNPQFRNYSTDKFEMYKLLEEFAPVTYCLEVGKLPDTNWFDHGAYVVVKKRHGMGGKGISRLTFSDLLAHGPYGEDMVVQEFIESDARAGGMKNFAGLHDLRCYIGGSDILGAHIRTPLTGNFVSNTSAGGRLTYLALNELPTKLKTFISDICATLPEGPRQFSVDSFYDPSSSNWKLIEINARAGWPSAHRGVAALATLDKIADYIVSEYKKVKQT